MKGNILPSKAACSALLVSSKNSSEAAIDSRKIHEPVISKKSQEDEILQGPIVYNHQQNTKNKN